MPSPLLLKGLSFKTLFGGFEDLLSKRPGKDRDESWKQLLNNLTEILEALRDGATAPQQRSALTGIVVELGRATVKLAPVGTYTIYVAQQGVRITSVEMYLVASGTVVTPPKVSVNVTAGPSAPKVLFATQEFRGVTAVGDGRVFTSQGYIRILQAGDTVSAVVSGASSPTMTVVAIIYGSRVLT